MKFKKGYAITDGKHTPYLLFCPKKSLTLKKGKIEAALQDAVCKLRMKGDESETFFFDFIRYAKLVWELGDRIQYIEIQDKGTGTVFQGCQFLTAYGRITVIPDRNAVLDVFYF